MKLAIVLSFLISTTQLSLAKPQYGGGRPRPTQRPFQPQPQTGPQCKTEYETVNKIEYEEYYDKVCQDTTRTQCDNVPTQQCKPKREQKCQNINRYLFWHIFFREIEFSIQKFEISMI